MFISAIQFERDMGVNLAIGRFFVDRKPPENNSFWKGRYLYIAYGNGYISIPVYYDLLFRIGVPLETLLEKNHIEFMEQLMHFAILRERNEIDKETELESIRRMLEGRIKDRENYTQLNEYLEQTVLKPHGAFGLPYPSLNRADVFLYVLCDLPLSKAQWAQAILYWYALHPSYLITDDIRDYASDKKKGEENVVLDLGGGAEGFEKTFDLLRQNAETLAEINPVLGRFLTGDEDTLRKYISIN